MASGTGEIAGCDRRATCTDEVWGGVRCVCDAAVVEAADSSESGTRCEQKAQSTAYFRSNQSVVQVRAV